MTTGTALVILAVLGLLIWSRGFRWLVLSCVAAAVLWFFHAREVDCPNTVHAWSLEDCR